MMVTAQRLIDSCISNSDEWTDWIPAFAGMTAHPHALGRRVHVVLFSSLPLWERGVCNATKNHSLSLYPSPTRGGRRGGILPPLCTSIQIGANSRNTLG